MLGQFIERCDSWFWRHLDAGSASKGSGCDRLAASVGDGSESTGEPAGKHSHDKEEDYTFEGLLHGEFQLFNNKRGFCIDGMRGSSHPQCYGPPPILGFGIFFARRFPKIRC